MLIKTEYVILGGGLSGLYAAYNLVKRGIIPLVLEANDEPGGLLMSIKKGDYTFDIGGTHVFYAFTPESAFYTQKLLKFLDNNLIKHERDARIYYNGQYLKFPFESGICELSSQERYFCLKGILDSYLKSKSEKPNKITNFEDWCYGVFGDYIGKKYLIPYNEKIWKRPLNDISLDWVKGRVPNPPLEDVMKASVGLQVLGSSSNSCFYYPKRGGIESLVKELISFLKDHGVKILTGYQISEIRQKKNHYFLKTENGKKVWAKHVISTLPLKEIPALIPNSPKEIKDAAEQLDYNSVITVNIGYETESPPFHWVYFPQKNIPFHRLAFLSNYSSNNAPKNCTSLVAEISCSPNSELSKRDDATILQETIESLEKLNLIDEKKIVTKQINRWKYAYIVYDHQRKDSISTLLAFLKDYGILQIGRFGSWNYWNMDLVIKNVEKSLDNYFLKIDE